MDRRSFLTGVLGLAGTAAVVTALKPASAVAGVPNRSGILGELDVVDAAAGDEPEVELIDHRYGHHRRRRRRRRRVWRRVCRRYWRHGRWRRRCRRQRVWVWYWV